MSANIEALYVYDDQQNPVIEHVYSSRPPSARTLLSLFLAHSSPRPSLLYLPDASPPTTVFSVSQAPLLFLCPSSKDVEPLVVLEFIHRVIDVFEDFLGAPLLAAKIESNYDVVAQLLGEICDGGVISNTEPNTLKENVEVSGLIGKLLTQVGLPGSSPAIGASNNLAATLKATSSLNSGPAIPWRRPNVRHTSNELYVDILEVLSVILAPSGRPISAIAAGSIAFTAKISGVPDLLLSLHAPGGTSSARSSGIARSMQLPLFHPCVRLARWTEHPGELSFIPPDGRFVLAGYEVDLLPASSDPDKPPSQAEKLFLPATADIRTGLGSNGCDFEVRLTLNTKFPGMQSSSKSGSTTGRPGTSTPSFSFGAPGSGNSNAPRLEAVAVSVKIPEGVRSITDLRPSRGEANYLQWDKTVQWKVPTKDGTSVDGTATLFGTVLGPLNPEDEDEDDDETDGTQPNPLLGYYDEGVAGAADPYQASGSAKSSKATASIPKSTANQKRIQANRSLMPRSVAVSFNVRGWLPSGIKVDSLIIDSRKSKGLGEGVKPYKGVKYLTVSNKGIERRV